MVDIIGQYTRFSLPRHWGAGRAAIADGTHVKLREVRPDAVLVMDNLAAHKTPAARAALDASGFAHRYLPSHSPDLNPIGPSWAKLGQAGPS